MTDLNLDGLPRLAFLVKHTGDSGIEGELRQLVERERMEASEDAEAESKERWELFQRTSKAKWRLQEELDKERERLPAWAKPVMRAVRELACSEPLSDEEDECCDKVSELGETLTEAQLKEIGEDD